MDLIGSRRDSLIGIATCAEVVQPIQELVKGNLDFFQGNIEAVSDLLHQILELPKDISQ